MLSNWTWQAQNHVKNDQLGSLFGAANDWLRNCFHWILHSGHAKWPPGTFWLIQNLPFFGAKNKLSRLLKPFWARKSENAWKICAKIWKFSKKGAKISKNQLCIKSGFCKEPKIANIAHCGTVVIKWLNKGEKKGRTAVSSGPGAHARSVGLFS